MPRYLLLLSALTLAVALSAQARPRQELPTPYGVDFSLASAAQAPGLPPLTSAPEAGAWLERIRDAEQQGGPYGASLPQTLLDAAAYFEERGDLERAEELWRRAVHVTRVNDGLQSPLQLPILRRLLDIYIARGDMESADSIHAYLYYLEVQDKPRRSQAFVDATVEYAAWQRRLWLLEPDRDNPERLHRIWRMLDKLFDLDEEAPLPAAQLAPLVYAQVQMLYLIGVSDFGLDREAEMLLGRGLADPRTELSGDRFKLQQLQESGYSRGLRRLELLAQRLASTGDDMARAEVARQLGDWHLWHGQSSRAADQYRTSWALLAGEAGAELRRQWYAEPVELPADAILWPGPRPVHPGDKFSLVRARFDVSERGRALNIEASAADEERAGDGYRLHRLLRDGLFRPRLESGEMVATTLVQREYRLQ